MTFNLKQTKMAGLKQKNRIERSLKKCPTTPQQFFHKEQEKQCEYIGLVY
jgi:hypothetical protein